MRATAAIVVGLAVVVFAAGALAADDEGFVPIFDGKTLTNWDGDPTFWSATDGCIRGESTKEKPCRRNTFCIWRGGDLVKDGMLGDFEMRISFRIRNGNSGIQYRSVDCRNWVVRGYQRSRTRRARSASSTTRGAAAGS